MDEPRIILRPVDLHWIAGTRDNPADLCAHAGVDFRIDGHVLIQPADGVWTVSAAAIFLLRTLSQSHTRSQQITEFLFPCCGAMFEVKGSDDVTIVGCNSGIDVEVDHSGEETVLSAGAGTHYRVTTHDWKLAVCGFSDAVKAFYDGSSPKRPKILDQADFKRFLSEWSRRRSSVASAV